MVWPAVRFVEWLRDEYRATSEANVTPSEWTEAA
jgi:hypothetical protein